MSRRWRILFCTMLAWSAVNCGAIAFAQAIDDPTSGEQFTIYATIAVDGYIDDAPNSVTIKMRRLSDGLIYASATQSVSDEGMGVGNFSVELSTSDPSGWPPDYYIIELWEDGSEELNVTIQIVSS